MALLCRTNQASSCPCSMKLLTGCDKNKTPAAFHTTEIGIFGALGKTKDVSSNLPLLRQRSDSHSLRHSQLLVSPLYSLDVSLPASSAASCQLQCTVLCTGLQVPLYLSPNPCATITVEVCLFKAGMTIAAGPDISRLKKYRV